MITDGPTLHVAVGVIKNAAGEVLISRRSDHVHQGGLWEFPGGKVEQGESVLQALRRELREELNIGVESAIPLIQVNHDYGDRKVLLDVWSVEAFSGPVRACEDQPLQWVQPGQLDADAFPAANKPIISAARLPRHYVILEGEDVHALLRQAQRILRGNVKLLQFRIKTLSASARRKFLQAALPLCRQQGCIALINSGLDDVADFAADGVHLTSRDLMALRQRPNRYAWVGASCHRLNELLHAQKIGVDFAVLAPVAATTTHPHAEPLGWQRFKAWVEKVNIPVYALGGMQLQDAGRAFAAGAQGIAGIRLYRD
ncbi:MAG: Nudix family hydrolase [Gammaproteobacteria bacterium]